jgi:hypothetical protein
MLSPELASIVGTLVPGRFLSQSDYATPDYRRPCPHCGMPVWDVATPLSRSILLNEHPSAWGRWFMLEPGIVIYCTGLRMIEWPLPRYTSHMMTCLELIRRREQQREERAAEMVAAKQQREKDRARYRERQRRSFDRIDAEAGIA